MDCIRVSSTSFALSLKSRMIFRFVFVFLALFGLSSQMRVFCKSIRFLVNSILRLVVFSHIAFYNLHLFQSQFMLIRFSPLEFVPFHAFHTTILTQLLHTTSQYATRVPHKHRHTAQYLSLFIKSFFHLMGNFSGAFHFPDRFQFSNECHSLYQLSTKLIHFENPSNQ